MNKKQTANFEKALDQFEIRLKMIADVLNNMKTDEQGRVLMLKSDMNKVKLWKKEKGQKPNLN